MMHVYLSHKDGLRSQHIDPSRIGEAIKDPNNLLWVDMEAPSEDDMRILIEQFGFHELALEDVTARRVTPKLNTYQEYCLIVMYAVSFSNESSDIELRELGIFAGGNYLVTLHDQPVHEADEVGRRWRENASKLDASVGVLLYTLLDTVVDGYLPAIDAIADRIEELESRLFGNVQDGTLGSIFHLRKELLKLRRILGPERDIFLQLSKGELPFLDPATNVYFQDVYDHIIHATDTTDLYRDLLSGALDSYLTISSNNLNGVMRTLTSVSIIMMTLTVITGIYGMNFVNMPELHLHYGYFVTLAIMAAISVALYIVLRRKRWL